MCEYCKSEKNIELTSDSAISHWFIINRNGVARLYCKMGESQTGNAYGIKINYCPFCGRKLREVSEND